MPENVEIGPLGEGDVMDLKELFGSSGPYVTQRYTSDYWLYTRLFSDTCLGARCGEELAGALISFRDQTEECREIYIQDLAVSPDYRGRGIGSALLEELIRRAGEMGIKRIWLTSEPGNTEAIELWRSLGFENTETSPDDYRDKETGLWITPDLKGPGRDRVVFSLALD